MLVKNKNNELVELTYETKLRAIEAHLNIKLDGEKYAFDGKRFDINGKKYLILSDKEANIIQNERLDNYIKNVLIAMPEECQFYFDSDSFKRDCRNYGRAHVIADGYYGKEISVIVDNIDLFIYRANKGCCFIPMLKQENILTIKAGAEIVAELKRLSDIGDLHGDNYELLCEMAYENGFYEESFADFINSVQLANGHEKDVRISDIEDLKEASKDLRHEVMKALKSEYSDWITILKAAFSYGNLDKLRLFQSEGIGFTGCFDWGDYEDEEKRINSMFKMLLG